jgi:hypothetical protein
MVPAIVHQSTLGFEPHDCRRVRAVTVGVDDTRRGMVLLTQSFGQEALCCGRVLLGREEKVEGGTGGVHRPIQVTPLAFDPDIRQSPLGQLSLVGLSLERKGRSISGA